MKLLKCTITAIGVLLILGFTNCAYAQSQNVNPKFQLEKGTILTSFSAGFIDASRNKNYNHEFEKAFDELRFNINGMYFITDKIAAGPVLGLTRVHREFEDPSGIETYEDRWEWEFIYGFRAGYFTPVTELLDTEILGNTHVFITGGLDWKKRNLKSGNTTLTDKLEMGYVLSGGLLLPVSKRAALELGLNWETRREEYATWEFDGNGNPVITGTDHRWPSVLSLGVGIKIGF